MFVVKVCSFNLSGLLSVDKNYIWSNVFVVLEFCSLNLK
jgi:hypothetical protein